MFAKSIGRPVWRLLAPPRNTLRSRQFATLESAPQPRRLVNYILARTHPTQPDIKPQSGDLAVADIIHGKSPTTEPIPRLHSLQKGVPWTGTVVWEETLDDFGIRDELNLLETPTTEPVSRLHSLQQSYQWTNVVLWAETLDDFESGDDLNLAWYRRSDKTIARRVAAKIGAQRHRIGKAVALEGIQKTDERLREIQWRRSIRLLITHTDIKEDNSRQDALDNGYGDRGRLRGYRFTQLPPARVPRPCTWSRDNFRDYVTALVESSVTGHLHQQLYHTGDRHYRGVARILQQLFGDPQWNAYTSIPACNTAMAFFYKHGQFAEARSIISLMEDKGLLTSSRSFNIMLRGSAHLKDVRNFEYILKQMIERGIRPNEDTWMVFYRISDSDQARSEIYYHMRDKGVLQDPASMRTFLTLTIRDVLVRQLEKGRSIAFLVEYLSGLDPILWHTPDIANVILDETGKRSPVQDVIKVLNQFERLGMIFDEVTMNTLLHHCLPNNDHDDAIEIIRCFRERYNLLPGRLAYDALFRQAWKRQYYNCSKVIWRYACSEGFASYRMKRFVANSLLRDLPSEPDAQSMTHGDIWRVAAGKLVVGLNLDVKSNAAFHGGSSSTSLLSRKESTTPALSDHEGRIENKWTECFSQDVALAYRVHIDESLDDLLRRASALDRQWVLESVSTQKSLEWMFQHSIRVRLKKNVDARLLNRPEHPSKHGLEEQHPLIFQGSENLEEVFRHSELYEAPERYESSSERYESSSELYEELERCKASELNEASELQEASELNEGSEFNEASELYETSKPQEVEQARNPPQQFSTPRLHLEYSM